MGTERQLSLVKASSPPKASVDRYLSAGFLAALNMVHSQAGGHEPAKDTRPALLRQGVPLRARRRQQHSARRKRHTAAGAVNLQKVLARRLKNIRMTRGRMSRADYLAAYRAQLEELRTAGAADDGDDINGSHNETDPETAYAEKIGNRLSGLSCISSPTQPALLEALLQELLPAPPERVAGLTERLKPVRQTYLDKCFVRGSVLSDCEVTPVFWGTSSNTPTLLSLSL